MFKIVYFLFLTFYYAFAKHEIYDGHALYKISVKDIEQTKLVNEIEISLDLDVWSHSLPNRDGQVLVPAEKRQKLQDALNEAEVEYRITNENIKEALELEDRLMASAARAGNRSFPLDSIHRYDVVNNYLEDVARRFPNIVTLASAGRSFEGRDIKYLRISSTNFTDRSKPVVIMESLLHCREWVGLPVTLYAIQKLVVEAAEPAMLRDIDWVIIPIANPDGYEFTHTNTRFWRKNRATGFVPFNFCLGVDLNRNFNSFWGTASDRSVCSDFFHGRAPFSEPETSAVRDIILEHKDRLALFLDIHSFSSMILYGFGNGQLPPNGLLLHVNAVLMAQTIDRLKWVSKPNYIVGNVAAVLYNTSGTAADYAQANGAPFSYTYELPAFRNMAESLDGFLVDPDFIEQAGFETWEGIKVGARYAANNYRRLKAL